eukprot:11210722-Lingulodinium_polyedra.AAC.1
MTRSSKAFCGVVRRGYKAHLDSVMRGSQRGGRAGREPVIATLEVRMYMEYMNASSQSWAAIFTDV